MSSSDGAGTAPVLAQPRAPSPLNGLDPESFTAHRLHHATPQHLHLTTRRCFIGPIPEAWLSRHRKSWYRYRPHLSTYSSRTASFKAGDNISPVKQLTGLDSALRPSDSNTARGGLSFPQPDDASEEGYGKSSQQHDAKSGEESPKLVTHTGDESPEQDEATLGGGSNTARYQNAPLSSRLRARIGSVKKRKDSTYSLGGSSFVTAQESLAKPATDESIVEASEPNDKFQNMERTEESHMGFQNSNRSSSNRMSFLDPDSARVETTDSTSSLLPHETPAQKKEYRANSHNHNEARDSVVPQEGRVAPHPSEGEPELAADSQVQTNESTKNMNAEIEPAFIDAVPEAPLDGVDPAMKRNKLKRLEPISTGFVRFNMPDQIHDKKANAQNKVLEASIKKPLNALSKPQVEPGELLKAERMLVRIDSTRHELPDDYSENYSQKAELRLVEKWRELIVVCRRSGNEGSDFILQMKKTRVIPVLDKSHRSKKVAHELPLKRHSTKINMYSSLDKTIVIWVPHKEGTRVYLLRPRSTASSVEWLTFLSSALGWRSPSSLTVHVPDLNLNLEIDHPFQETAILNSSLYQSKDDERQASDAAVLSSGQAAKTIIALSLNMLKQSSVADVVDTWAANGERIGLAWKRYDRLEWIHDMNEESIYGSMTMRKTHELELRPKRHYPTQASGKAEALPFIEEPAPTEGFLVRLTSQKGRDRRFGKTFFKKLYFSTHNQFLCFTTPAKAMPPKPPKLLRAHGDQLPSTSEIAEKIPLIYSVNPFPIKDGKITWLDGTSLAKKKDSDQLALEESERVVKTLQDSEGYINLCHVTKVRKAHIGTPAPRDQEGADHHSHYSEDSDISDNDQENPIKEGLANRFELVLKNGLVVRLQAYDKTTRKEWVKRLREIIKYWKLKIAEDMDLYKHVRNTNLEQLDIDEEMESYLGQFAEKWEVIRALASADLFNMCGIACCRSVTMSGVLYRKPRLHSTFDRCNVIVCHGKLLIFQSTLRKNTGKEIPHIHHERQEVVDLKGTYVYSGLVTEGDLLYHNQTFDSNHPGHHALPRIYLEDNWTSSDEDTTTCFVIWYGKRKSFFKAKAQQDDGRVKQKLRYVSTLGVTGRSMVFKTRSRAERDHWVMNIGMEIGRLQQSEDIRVIPRE